MARPSAVLFPRDQLLSGLFLVAAQNKRQAVPEMIRERSAKGSRTQQLENVRRPSDSVLKTV